jgi:hypothetical protein
MTLQPNLHLGLWHNLIIYEPHCSSKMDNGWLVIWSQRTWHIAKSNVIHGTHNPQLLKDPNIIEEKSTQFQVG